MPSVQNRKYLDESPQLVEGEPEDFWRRPGVDLIKSVYNSYECSELVTFILQANFVLL
jgi:hypothetical protein